MTLELVRGRVTDRIDTLIKFAQDKLAGLSRSEALPVAFGLLNDAIHNLVPFIEQFSIIGSDKKQAVIDAVLRFYDNVIAPRDLPYIPNIIIEPKVDAALRICVEVGTGMAIDLIVRLFNKTEWPKAE